MLNIENAVSKALEGASNFYLEDIINHGIHNLTNDFHGQSEDEYKAYAEEFKKQAQKLLDSRN